MKLKPTLIWLGALLRRIVGIAIGAITALAVANWQDWVDQGVAGDKKAAMVWGIVLLVYEAIQKAARVRRDVKNGG